MNPTQKQFSLNRAASKKEIPISKIGRRKIARSAKVKRTTRAERVALVTKIGRHFTLAKKPSMALTARYPYDTAGFMEANSPLSWDCFNNLVLMSAWGREPSGQSVAGTSIHVRFTPPSKGSYLVVGNFSGYRITMTLIADYGAGFRSNAYCATPSESVAVTALATRKAGETLFILMLCEGGSKAYLESIEIYLLS